MDIYQEYNFMSVYFRIRTHMYNHGCRNKRGGGAGTIAPPLPIFCQPKNFKSLKTTTYNKSVYCNKARICSELSGYWKSQIY